MLTKTKNLTTDEKKAVIEAVTYRLSVVGGRLAASSAGMDRNSAKDVKNALKRSKTLLQSARRKLPHL